jgi:hypothetical protein
MARVRGVLASARPKPREARDRAQAPACNGAALGGRGILEGASTAYDRHLESVRDRVVEASVTEQTRALATMLRVGSREIELLAQVQDQLERPGAVSPAVAARFVDRAVTLLQLLSGKPTERVATVEQDLSKLSAEQLEQLAAIRAELDGG